MITTIANLMSEFSPTGRHKNAPSMKLEDFVLVDPKHNIVSTLCKGDTTVTVWCLSNMHQVGPHRGVFAPALQTVQDD